MAMVVSFSRRPRGSCGPGALISPMATGSFAGVLSLAQATAEIASTPQPSHFAALRPRYERIIVCLLGGFGPPIGPASSAVQTQGQRSLRNIATGSRSAIAPHDPISSQPGPLANQGSGVALR